ncbi:MAG: hypothetical protein ACXU9U_05620 [Parachlamydiaceae bacterium]
MHARTGYHKGKGLKKDKQQAKHCYQLAANQGLENAEYALRKLGRK